MNEIDDGLIDDSVIDALLRRQFEGPVVDAGFSARVMQALPRRRSIAWPLWLGLAAGAAVSWLALADAPLLRAGWYDWLGGELSPTAGGMLLAMAALAWLALGWALAESDDR